MDSISIYPQRLKGTFAIPPSKSQTMRALIFASKAQSPSKIKNLLDSPDTNAMINALSKLGASIANGQVTPHPWTLPKEPIDAGNSGQVYRFIRALAPVEIVGDTSIMTRRPIQPLLDGLEQLPNAHIDGADSQPVSGLLMAMAFRDGVSTLRVDNPGEKPWVGMTLSWFDRLGITYTNENYKKYTVTGPAKFPGFTYTVPADFSSAAFPWALQQLGHDITLSGLCPDPAQGDAKLLTLDPLAGGIIDVNDIIDSIPILAVLGCFAKSPLTLFNGAIARKKESDRISAITKELRKMGAHIEEHEDGLTAYPSTLHGANLDSHADHRVSMSLIVAALNATSPSTLTGTACIAKSYPNFIKEVMRCSSYTDRPALEKAHLANV